MDQAPTTDRRLYDNTRISDFKRCPRQFYFRHRMHWIKSADPDMPAKSVPLIYGSAWHKAMEVVWAPENLHLGVEALSRKAYDAFMESWIKDGMPAKLDYETEERLSPRTPGHALEMIVGYVEARLPQLKNGTLKVLAIEKPFAVPLDPNDPGLFYVGKIDKIVERTLKVLGVEHKSTTAYASRGGFREAFLDSFSPNSQVDGYLYALHLMFPGRVGGVWIDAALVHKSAEAFKFIPIERQLSHLDTWLWEVRYWIEQIRLNDTLLASASTDGSAMMAFPKNTNSCWDFNTPCQYLDLCKAWSNPFEKEMPSNYRIYKWDPLEHTGAAVALPQETKNA